VKEIIEEDNQEKQNVHRLIISSSELREREYLTTKSYFENKKHLIIFVKKNILQLICEKISYIHGDRRDCVQ